MKYLSPWSLIPSIIVSSFLLLPIATRATSLSLGLTTANIAELTGEAASDDAGFSVASAGDVNNDGYDDLLIGAYGNDDAGSNAGAAYLIYGQSSALTSASLSTAIQFTGEAASDDAGFSVASAGDVNNDGYDDLLIGAYGNDDAGSNAGAAYLIYGQATAFTSAGLNMAVQFTGEAASDRAGSSVASVGDVNNDGYDDLLIGAYGNDDAGSNAGAAYLIYGQAAALTSASLSTAVQFTGEAADDLAGFSVASSGDVNNDGYDDLLIGAYLNDDAATNAGAAYLIYGQSTALTSASLSTAVQFTGEAASDLAGFSVASAGDVNNDGYDDLLIGAYGIDDGAAASNAGAAYLIYGQAAALTSASLSTAVQFTGEAASDLAGFSVASAGDVNNDGYDDFLVGAYGNDDAASDAGAAYLIYGQSSALTSASLSTAVQFTGEAASDLAGRSVASAGDVNNDGYNDFLIGAYENDDAATDAGAAYVVYAQPSTITITNNTSTVNTLECGIDTFTDPGATATDQYTDTSLTVSTTDTVVNTPARDATVTYTTASNTLHITSSDNRTVTVSDTTIPSISILGSAEITHQAGTDYTDAGASASDACAGNLTDDMAVVNSVDTNTIGTYTVTYDISDSSGNAAAEVVRTVTVLAYTNDPSTGDGDGSGDTEETLGEVTDLTPLNNNRVQVTYAGGTTKTFQLFSNGSAKAKVRLHTNGQLLIAINKKSMRTFNAFTGEHLYSKKLFKKNQYNTKFKRYNIYKKVPGVNNIMVLAQTKQKQKQQFKLRAFVVKNTGKIVARNTERVTTSLNTKFSKLNTKKNKKSAKQARVIVTRKGKNVPDNTYKVTKKKGSIIRVP